MSPDGAAGSRHAVYYMPGDDEPLARFGARVLRDDAPGDAPACRAGRVARPRVYGFHATLKAPFRLRERTSAEALIEAVGERAARLAPVPLGPLRVCHRGGSTWLETVRAVPRLDALAANLVTSLDGFRALPTEADRRRRRVDELDAAARARFERWGYPWVLAGFHFHLTLGASGPATTPAQDAAWVAWLEALLDEHAVGPTALDRLAVCRQDAPGEPFERLVEIPLTGTAPAPPFIE